jgi:hypothetical protein
VERTQNYGQSRWPLGVRRRSLLLGHCNRGVRIPLEAWMFVFICCVVLCRQRPLRRAEHSSIVVLPSVLIRLPNLRCKALTRVVDPLMMTVILNTVTVVHLHVRAPQSKIFRCLRGSTGYISYSVGLGFKSLLGHRLSWDFSPWLPPFFPRGCDCILNENIAGSFPLIL